MQQPSAQRKLAAILCADVAGYSRLVEAAEEDTIARLRALLRDPVESSVGRWHGRIVKTAGDGVLAEFPSVVDALRCAVEIQRAVAAAGQDVAENRRIRFRIGVNLGDVVSEAGDLYGDGVNITARLQELSPAGGICVSRAAYDQVGDRLGLDFEDLGPHSVKNIQRPVRVYRVVLDDGPPASVTASSGPAPATVPSIAVLPLANMSGDSAQDFFADGMTEDIITALSRFRELFVISRTSSFAYKGKAVNLQQVARELGVHYVVEGSVRKAGSRVRVTVQLIDAETGRQVWAERYDRELEDLFALQDEITGAIVATLPGRIEAAARDRVTRKPPGNMTAYECVLAGKLLHHRSNREANAEAQRLLDRAIALDPRYAHAHAWKACVLGQTWVNGWGTDRDRVIEQVSQELKIALSLDDNDSDTHRILAALNLALHDFDKAVYHQERALGLNPNDDLIVVQQGEILTWLGRAEEGIPWIRKAMRLNPYHPERYWNHLGRACYAARRYGEAAEAFRHISQPDQTHHAFLAASLAQLGDSAAAATQAAESLKRDPGFSTDAYLATLHYRLDADREHHRDGLLKAGLPA